MLFGAIRQRIENLILNVVFIGSSKFGLKCLKLLVESSFCTIKGVVSAPSAFKISYNPDGVTNVLHADIPSFCTLFEIDFSVINSGMNDDQLLEKVRGWRPDLFIVVGWYHMIPRKWRDMAPAFGMHASLLPNYCGGAPLVWAIINDEKSTGITLFKMDGGVDSGPIVGQLSEPIHADDTIATLYDRIEERGLELLILHLPELAKSDLSLAIQNVDDRKVFPQRSPQDGKINWESSAEEIDRFIRAQTHPYPGAFTFLNDERLTIWQALCVSDKQGNEPGTLTKDGGIILVATGTYQLQLTEFSFNGHDYNLTEKKQGFRDKNQCMEKVFKKKVLLT
jgi:methionyl-tRNA formyltransferase